MLKRLNCDYEMSSKLYDIIQEVLTTVEDGPNRVQDLLLSTVTGYQPSYDLYTTDKADFIRELLQDVEIRNLFSLNDDYDIEKMKEIVSQFSTISESILNMEDKFKQQFANKLRNVRQKAEKEFISFWNSAMAILKTHGANTNIIDRNLANIWFRELYSATIFEFYDILVKADFAKRAATSEGYLLTDVAQRFSVFLEYSLLNDLKIQLMNQLISAQKGEIPIENAISIFIPQLWYRRMLHFESID